MSEAHHGKSDDDVQGPVGDQAPAVQPRRDVAPVEGLTTALQMQAEVLRRLHEEQKKLGEEVRDRGRSDLMIRSAQALNDSFAAMRQSQEQLVNTLEDSRPARKRLLLVVALGFVVLAGAVTFSVLHFGKDVSEGLGREFANDKEREQALTLLEQRLQGVEGREREVLLEEVQKLRSAFEANAFERARLERERDEARKNLASAEARSESGVQREQTLNDRLRQSDMELARLTERALADQKLVAELNKALENARAALPHPVSMLTHGSGAKDAAPVGTASPAPQAVDDAFIATVNALLARHSGYEKHVVRSCTGVDETGLLGVVVEVRSRDDQLSRVVEADKLSIALTARTRLLELTFQRGNVTFHQGVARPVRSPFFNERYQIVLVGVESDAWTSARLPFTLAAAR
ncbi:MAG: hypothetical protein EXS14_04385 [Planctomycetes bacterium]|nr:hypothetical protein [Planctomycetota bacterium]